MKDKVAKRFTLDNSNIERKVTTKICGVWIGEDPSCWEKNTKEIMKRTYVSTQYVNAYKVRVCSSFKEKNK